MMRIAGIALSTALLVAGSVSKLHADLIYAGSPGDVRWHYVDPGGTVGTEFTSNVTEDVVSLGIFDAGADGLAGSHEVALYTSTGTLLASVTIPAGTAAPLVDGYRWISVSAPLVQGQNYVVAAGYYDDHGADYFGTTASINPAFTLVTDLYADGGGPTIAFPNTPYLDSLYGPGNYGWYGPNLQVGDAVALAAVETVPEPASLVVWSLFGVSICGATWWRRSKVAA